MCRAGGVCNMCRAGGVCNMCHAGGALWCVCRAGGNMCHAGGMCAAQEVLCGVCAAQEVIMFRVGGLCAAAGLYLWATVRMGEIMNLPTGMKSGFLERVIIS